MRKTLLFALMLVALVSAWPAAAQTPTPTVTPTATPTRTPTVTPTPTATPTAGGSWGRVGVTPSALGVQTLAAPVAAGHTLTFTAADPVWGNAFTCTGKEVLLVENTHATDAKTVTIKGAPDAWGRVADITSYSLAAGQIAYFGPFPAEAFRRSDGKVWIVGSDATVEFAVIRIP